MSRKTLHHIRPIVVSSIAINAIPNFMDITLSGSSFDKPSSSITRCPFGLDAFYAISSAQLSGQSFWSSVKQTHRQRMGRRVFLLISESEQGKGLFMRPVLGEGGALYDITISAVGRRT